MITLVPSDLEIRDWVLTYVSKATVRNIGIGTLTKLVWVKILLLANALVKRNKSGNPRKLLNST